MPPLRGRHVSFGEAAERSRGGNGPHARRPAWRRSFLLGSCGCVLLARMEEAEYDEYRHQSGKDERPDGGPCGDLTKDAECVGFQQQATKCRSLKRGSHLCSERLVRRRGSPPPWARAVYAPPRAVAPGHRDERVR